MDRPDGMRMSTNGGGHRRSVLIAEDAPATRDALTSLLEAEGYHVTAAADGREALQLLGTLDPGPHVVIVDLDMPTMDGFAFREEQTKRESVAHLPVIAVTGHAGLRRHALHMGFTAALQKPCDVSMLLSLVAHHCKPRAAARTPRQRDSSCRLARTQQEVPVPRPADTPPSR